MRKLCAKNWQLATGNWFLMLYDVTIDGKNHRIDLNHFEGRWSCTLDGRTMDVDATLVHHDVLSLRLGNKAYEIKSERVGGELHLWVGNRCFAVEVRDPRSLRSRARAGEDYAPRRIKAAMPGKVVRVLVSKGDAVALGAGLVVVEAMKMQNEIKSPKQGTIQKILVTPGTAVNAGDVLAIVE